MDDETSDVLRRIAGLVAAAQRTSGLSTAALAGRSGVRQTVIEGLMRFEEDPGLDAIYRLAGALEVSAGDLIQGIEWIPDGSGGGRWRIEDPKP